MEQSVEVVLVIPAKAGIYSASLWKCAVVALDSRFRGNDRRLEWIPIPNDTTTTRSAYLEPGVQKGIYWFSSLLKAVPSVSS